MSLRNQLLRYSLVLIGIFPGQATYSQTEGQLNPSDIGSSSLASSSNFNASTNSYHLSATGGQIWGSQDNFHFYNQAITGNVEVTVQVEALQSSGNKAKAGIMLRQSLDDDSIHAFLAASSGDKAALERRREIAGGTTRSGKGNIPVPVWLRLVRIGTYISSYYSTDGDKWEFLAEDTINFSSPIFVGMAISSELKNKTIEADFSDFTVVDLDQAPASETYVSSDIGKVVVNGVAVFDPEKESYLVEASGGDIGHTQDAFHYVYHELSGDFEGVVKLDSLVAQEDWAKAGLMIRADLHPQSQYFALFMAKNIGVVYQSRVTLGGESNWSKTDAIADPVWIKLTRTGNLFQAHYSLNGTDWILQDEITMAFPESVLFGMAVTSHQEGSLAYAEFSNLSDTASAAPADNTSTGGGTNTGGGEYPVDPVAGFSRVTSSGGDSLTIQVDGSSSISGDHPIVSYSWDWGDGSSNSSGVQATHTYQNAGVYMVVLTITDQSGASQRSSQPVQVTSGSLPSSEIQIVEKGYHHVRLRWADNQRWDAPWLIQRSTVSGFVDPTIMMNNQAEDNTSTGTFRWLGINATQYVDIDDLEEGLTYYYRVATCTNLSDHYQKGVKPQFSAWQYGQVTMGTLEASKKRTFDVTAYGAIANDGNNDYPAALAAFKAAQAAGGGQVYFPAGNWDLWPVDPGVSLVNGIPTLLSGQNASSRLFYVTADNITFKGAAANGNPTSFLKFYLWHKQPATKYMEVLSGGAGSSVKNVRRYFIFLMGNAKNFTLKDLDIDMGAVPVNTGKGWYSLDEKRYQWDISHKLLASFDNSKFKNVVIENIRAKNCRGEIIYNGGGSEKLLITDSVFSRSNSSTLSGTFDLELVNTTIRDSANAAIESNCLNDAVSFDTGDIYPMNHIARGCTFIGLDQSSQGFMKDLPGKKNFGGWLCFNEEGTYQSVTDSTFRDMITVSFGPWYEYRNGFRFNVTFNEIPANQSGQIIYTWTSAQSLYTLLGGMSNILWLGDTINVTRSWPNHQVFFYSQPGPAAVGNESPWIWEAVRFKNVNGGAKQINRLWVDTGGSNSRQDAVFKDWTADANITFDEFKFQFLSASHSDPEYINFLQ